MKNYDSVIDWIKEVILKYIEILLMIQIKLHLNPDSDQSPPVVCGLYGKIHTVVRRNQMGNGCAKYK